MQNKYEQKALIIDVESLIPNIQKRVDVLGKQAELEKNPTRGNALIEKFNEYSGSLSFLEDNLKIFKEKNAYEYIDELIKSAEIKLNKAYEKKSDAEILFFNEHLRKLEIARDLVNLERGIRNVKADVIVQLPGVSNEQLKVEEAPFKKEQLKSAREKIRDSSFNEKEKQLLAEIIKQGGILMHMSIPEEFTGSGHSGFQTKYDNKLLQKQTIANVSIRSFMEDNEIDEHLSLSPEIRYEKTVTLTPRKGFLGRQLEPLKEYKTTSREIRLNEVIAGASDEPAFSLTYTALDGNLDEKIYKDNVGRGGNIFMLKIYLPKTLGMNVVEAIKANPRLVRELSDRIVVQQLNIPANAWFHGDKHTGAPLRPPYDEWKKRRGENRIYIDETGKDSRNFRQDLVHQVK